MKKFGLYMPVIALAATLLSCREVYYPDDIESNEDIPVIQGIIEEDAMAEIHLYWAVSYDSAIRYIDDAEVTVTNDLGEVAECFQNLRGRYFSYGMTGKPGRTYTLRVKLSDGREYLSKPQMMMFRPQLDSLYAIPGNSSTYEYGSSGNPIIKQMQGLFINSDFSTAYPGTLYYRFNTSVVKLSSYTVFLRSPASYSIFLWETSAMDNSYSVDRSTEINNVQVIFNHQAGFLRYYYDVSLATLDQTAPFTDAWVVKQNIYSISSDVYQYYNSVGNLLGGNNRIFAPVASHVKSNISCITDPGERVIGLFEASSVTTIYKAFGWKNLFSYESKNLEYFPDVGTGSMERFPPYFWIYF